MSKRLFLFGAIIVSFSILLSGQSAREGFYLNFEVANDVLYLPIKTDQYFTSGLSLEVGKWKRAATPFREGSTIASQQYWRIAQHIYTPKLIDESRFLKNDRPFASYLIATRGKSFTDAQLGLGLRWELTAGVLGNPAGGGKAQNAFHSLLSFADPVPGWTHEVKPDLILNYELRLSQRFYTSPRFSFTTALTGSVGSLYTNLSHELNFSWLAIRLDDRHSLRFDLFGNAKLVGYDATLKGGLFNRDDRYRERIRTKPFVGLFGFDGTVVLGGLRLSGGLRHLSREFDGGLSHAWAWFSIGGQPKRRTLNR